MGHSRTELLQELTAKLTEADPTRWAEEGDVKTASEWENELAPLLFEALRELRRSP